MVDIHSHVLYGVDHGASSKEQTVSMLQGLEKSGVTDLFCTSHYYAMNEGVNTFYERYMRVMDAVRESNPTAVKLHCGAEVTMSRYFHYAEPPKELFLEGTNKMLVELCFSEDFEDWQAESVAFLKDSYGITPIIAHVEMYPYIMRDPSIAIELKNMGAELQIDAGSLKHGIYKKALDFLIKNKIIDYVASDIHFDTHKTSMQEGIELLKSRGEETLAQNILANADKLLIGR